MMSMISALIDRLRDEADCYKAALGEDVTIPSGKLPELINNLDDAIFTIDELSAKVRTMHGGWIPIKYHGITDEERQEGYFPEETAYLFDCQMPEDNEEILVCHKNGWVGKDTCYIDEGYTLDSGWDWIDDVIAWMPLPAPYEEET